MADDKHYVGGDYYQIDDLSGRKVRASKTRRMWYGTMRAPPSWEPRQPQDLVRGVRDDQTVAVPRPRSPNVFVGPIETTLSQDAAINASTLYLDSTAGMAFGDRIGVMLNNGDMLFTIIGGLNTSLILTSVPLPFGASSGNVFYDYGPSGIVVPPNALVNEFGIPILTNDGQFILVA